VLSPSPAAGNMRKRRAANTEPAMAMTYPLRKLAGTVALLVLLVVYSMLVMVFATTRLPELGGVATTLFYAVAGLAWVPLAMALVSWMYRRG